MTAFYHLFLPLLLIVGLPTLFVSNWNKIINFINKQYYKVPFVKPKEPVILNLKKANVNIVLLDLKEFKKEILGRQYKAMDRYFHCEANYYFNRWMDENETMLECEKNLFIPKCQIKEIKVVYSDYFEEEKE